MTLPNVDEESTQIRRPPPSSIRNISERYNASIIILSGFAVGGKAVKLAAPQHKDKFRIGDTTVQFILQDTGEGRLYEISE